MYESDNRIFEIDFTQSILDSVRIIFVDAWEWVVLQWLSEIEIHQGAVFTEFIPLYIYRILTDLFPVNVDHVNFGILSTSVPFFI